ncbi:MAG: molybdopterin-binding protein [Chloroflexota bacterium]|nr:molybdopterin-binding protein [Chloroflexota bacterium]
MTATSALRRAELLAIGTELTTGSTRDTNSGDLAAELSARGVEIGRVTALPDRLEEVSQAFAAALRRADLVISTGGLGPTPDDLTREAIAAVCAATPFVDPLLERWLRDRFARRAVPMAESNLKQAWLIPGAEALPNAQGTAPGWWVEAGQGRIIVALPGPPREMWPMWRAEALPRLEQHGLGQASAAETLRLTGIGESALADLIGGAILRAPDPEVATYARADAVDVRVSAFGPGAGERVRLMVAGLEPRLKRWIFARGDATWADALEQRLAGRTLATVEIGTAGQLAALLGSATWFARGEVLPDERQALRRECQRVREVASSDIGLALRASERREDTAVSVAIAVGGDVRQRTRTAFLPGAEGRRRAALAACDELWRQLAPDSGSG